MCYFSTNEMIEININIKSGSVCVPFVVVVSHHMAHTVSVVWVGILLLQFNTSLAKFI